MDPKKIAIRIAGTAKAKRAEKACILDIRKVASFSDYFVILSATSLKQVNTIARAIEEDLAKDKIKPLSKALANDESGWVVLDFVSVVAHIFYKPLREFYSLERLWSDAKRVSIPLGRPKKIIPPQEHTSS